MHMGLRCFIVLTALAAVMAVLTPVAAQDSAAPTARAIRILDELDRLLDRVLSRRAVSAQPAVGSVSLFDGQSLGGWKVTDFAGGGEVKVEKSFKGGPPAIIVSTGLMLSGFAWSKETPRTNYEVELEFLKIEGNDFACGLTFPVAGSYASLILGGWGGGVVGISSIDERDASENETTKVMAFPKDKWFKVRLQVSAKKLQAWLDDKPIIDQDITGRRISLRPGEIIKSVPFGIATFQTSAAFRGIRIRSLPAESTN